MSKKSNGEGFNLSVAEINNLVSLIRMRNMQWMKQVNYYSLLLIAFFIPAHTRFTGIFVTTAVISWLISIRFRFSFAGKNIRYTIFCLATLYFCYALGMLFTANQAEGWQHMQLWLTMVIFPVMFLSSSEAEPPSRIVTMKWFVAGSILISLILLAHGTFIFFTMHTNIFFYGLLTEFLKIHPAYLSMYFVFIIVSIMWQMLQYRMNRRDLVFHTALVLFFLLMVILLSAREELIALIVVVIIMFAIHFTRKRSFLAGAVCILSAIGLMIFLLFIFPAAGQRFLDIANQWDQSYSNASPNSISVRKAAWETASALIKEHPFTGVGTGDVESALLKRYRENKLEWPLNDKLNAHNQFLQTFLGIGIFGLAALLLLFVFSFRIAVKSKNNLYLFFLLIFLISIITESMFETETGVIFFTYFNSLFIAAHSKKLSAMD